MNAHLNVQVSSIAQELSQKSEEIRKYHKEHAVVFQRIRELIGQPVEAVTKARQYDHIMDSGDPIIAQKTIPILVKYSRLMNGLFEDVQKSLPPGGTPWRVLYQTQPGSPSGTLYDAVGEVTVVHNPPTAVEPGVCSTPGSTGKAPERAHSSQPMRKSTGSDRSGRGQSPVHWTPTDLEHRTGPELHSGGILLSEREPSVKGKSREYSSSPPECMMLEAAPTTSRAFRASGTTHQE